MANGNPYIDEIDAALKAAEQQPASTTAQPPVTTTPPGQPDYQAEIARAVANTPQAGTGTSETFGPPAPQPQPYQGQILPWRTDASGNTIFDPLHSGITGAAIDAFSLPGDVWTGKQQTPYSGGTAVPDPALLDRIMNLAQFFPQGSPIGNRIAPTGAELKAASDAGYAAARANPTTIPSSLVAPYARDIQQTLQGNPLKLTERTAPKTFDALDNLANQKGNLGYTDFEATRRELSGIKPDPTMGGSDPLAASHAIDHLDNLIDAIWPEAAPARANAAAGFRANTITGDLTQANTGVLERGDTAAQLRQRVKTLTQSESSMRGFSPEEIQTLTDFAKGNDVLTSALTKAGKIPGSGIVAAGLGAYLGSTYLGGHGGEIGAMIGPMVGDYFKNWATQRASNQLDAIGQMLRSRSPLGQEYKPNLLTPNPLPYRIAVPSLLHPPSQGSPPAVAPPAQFSPLPTTGPIPAGLLGPWA